MSVVEYEGKAKFMLSTENPSVMIQRFKDSATAFNGQKKAELAGKGVLNNAISSAIFERLKEEGVDSHFLGRTSPRDMRVKRLSMIPLEVVVRNVVAGSLHKRLGFEEGATLSEPIVETYYKRDDLGDPIVTDDHVVTLAICNRDELTELKERGLAVNAILRPWFAEVGLVLVDFKLEFGRDADGGFLLGDEISPDTCRIWDRETSRKLDKDVFRRALGDAVEGYREVAQRLGILIEDEE